MVSFPMGVTSNVSNKTSFRLPFLFIITGMIAFVAFHLFSLTELGRWIDDFPRYGLVLSNVHLLVLGWGTMIAMGAVYQLIQVVLQKEVFSIRLGYVHYLFFTIGVLGLTTGFRSSEIGWIALFACFAFIGFLLFAINLGVTLLRAQKWDTITISVAFALLYLLLNGATGMLMGLNFAFGGLGDFHDRLFGAHIWFGAIGWFGLLITGFSYKLLPMFVLAHDYPTKLQTVVLILWNIGVIWGATSFLMDAPLYVKWISAWWIAAAFVVYAIHLNQIYRKRFKENSGTGVIFTLKSTQATALLVLILVLLAPFTMAWDWQTPFILIAGWIYLWGWVAFQILGYLSKIVPFLWWTYKYGSVAGKGQVPKLSDMVNDSLIKSGLYALAASLILLVAGIGFELEMLVAIAGSALSLFAIGYMAIIALTFTK